MVIRKIGNTMVKKIRTELLNLIYTKILSYEVRRKIYEIIKYLRGDGKYKYEKMGYLDASKIIREARSSGLTVPEYVEKIFGGAGQAEEVINEIRGLGALENVEVVCEIGPGTGMYLDKIIRYAKPKQYHIYETASDWATYLEKTYYPLVIKHDADGYTLRHTPDSSCDLVVAFGVFVYLDFLNCFEYFKEMVRVCKKDKFIVFDCFLDDSWDEATIQKWIDSGWTYPVVLPSRLVINFFENRNFKLVHRFRKRHGPDFSDYLVFKGVA
jgi:hypothetical protein